MFLVEGRRGRRASVALYTTITRARVQAATKYAVKAVGTGTDRHWLARWLDDAQK